MLVTGEDLDFQDSGSEYIPSPASSSNIDDFEQAHSVAVAEPQPSTSGIVSEAETSVLKGKKRVRKPESWQRNVNKLNRAKVNSIKIKKTK